MALSDRLGANLMFIAAIIAMAFLVALLMPVGLHAIADTKTTKTVTNTERGQLTTTQDEEETINLSSTLTANTTNIQDPVLLDNPSVDVKITNTTTGNNTTQRVDEGQTLNITVDGENVTTTVNDVINETTADMTYDYPKKVDSEKQIWSTDTERLYGLLDLIIVAVTVATTFGLYVRARTTR